jgi:hypothetical protein
VQHIGSQRYNNVGSARSITGRRWPSSHGTEHFPKIEWTIISKQYYIFLRRIQSIKCVCANTYTHVTYLQSQLAVAPVAPPVWMERAVIDCCICLRSCRSVRSSPRSANMSNENISSNKSILSVTGECTNSELTMVVANTSSNAHTATDVDAILYLV